MRVAVLGAGVFGLVTATVLAERGVEVTLYERNPHLGGNASWLAGGMLAPFCEGESASARVVDSGQRALAWWVRHAPVVQKGTLVVAPARDGAELDRYAARTHHWQACDAAQIAELEPDLAERFRRGLFYAGEAHLDPRETMRGLAQGIDVRFGQTCEEADYSVDCRGFAARDTLFDLRGVRGEMVLVRTREVRLQRPVRLLHPRMPVYIVPRADGVFMIGATMMESAERGGVTVRSAVELLGAAFALHPAFGEAEILELGADIRPAFPDNEPQVIERGGRIYLNGAYRHGWLLAPDLAMQAAERIVGSCLT